MLLIHSGTTAINKTYWVGLPSTDPHVQLCAHPVWTTVYSDGKPERPLYHLPERLTEFLNRISEWSLLVLGVLIDGQGGGTYEGQGVAI